VTSAITEAQLKGLALRLGLFSLLVTSRTIDFCCGGEQGQEMHDSYGVGVTGVGRLALLRVGSGVGSISGLYSGHVLERQGQCGRSLGLEQVIGRQEQVVGAQLVYGDARGRMPWTGKKHIPCRLARKLALFGLKLVAWS